MQLLDESVWEAVAFGVAFVWGTGLAETDGRDKLSDWVDSSAACCRETGSAERKDALAGMDPPKASRAKPQPVSRIEAPSASRL